MINVCVAKFLLNILRSLLFVILLSLWYLIHIKKKAALHKICIRGLLFTLVKLLFNVKNEVDSKQVATRNGAENLGIASVIEL